VTAILVPAAGVVADAALARALQDHVKTRLAAHSYPRSVVFRDALPMTATGKVMRGEIRRALTKELP
jgi:acetyl-CoA synthetase